jgi:hypothetical protein
MRRKMICFNSLKGEASNTGSRSLSICSKVRRRIAIVSNAGRGTVH